METNLKAVLTNLAIRLIKEHRFMPAADKGYGIPDGFYDPKHEATHLLSEFIEFINSHPEAQQILQEGGFEWPMPGRKKRVKKLTTSIEFDSSMSDNDVDSFIKTLRQAAKDVTGADLKVVGIERVKPDDTQT